METTMTSKGQIVIPSRLRRKYAMEEGTRIEFIEDEKSSSLILKPITPQYVHSLRGILKGGGGMKALQEDRQKEKEL
jgi:AbrB family looped-hinge helix DNA binding protein